MWVGPNFLGCLVPTPKRLPFDLIICLDFTRPDLPMKDAAYTPHGDDVIFLAKELVNSDHLSQQPLVVFPKDFLSKLNKPLVPMERHPIADRARKERPVTKLLCLKFAPGHLEFTY